jgi:hypothetical protein
MLHPDRPAILFYIAHCHSDLTWYLSVDTARQSANENRVREPTECECAITEYAITE